MLRASTISTLSTGGLGRPILPVLTITNADIFVCHLICWIATSSNLFRLIEVGLGPQEIQQTNISLSVEQHLGVLGTSVTLEHAVHIFERRILK